MPSVLAIETSTPLGSVAVVHGNEVIYERKFSSERSHNSQLFMPLREALEASSGSLGAIVVGTGPASYTGVRIGIAAAQGVALSLGVPVIGLASVLAVESSKTVAAPPSYFLCGDARRGAFFLTEVKRREEAADIAIMDAEELRRRHAELVGNAAWFTFDRQSPLGLAEVHGVSPSASVLAQIAAGLGDDELARRAQAPLEPYYLSAPFVTMPKK